MSQKKRVRIYKAGGQQGAYINPTAKWMMQMGGAPQEMMDTQMQEIQSMQQPGMMDPNIQQPQDIDSQQLMQVVMDQREQGAEFKEIINMLIDTVPGIDNQLLMQVVQEVQMMEQQQGLGEQPPIEDQELDEKELLRKGGYVAEKYNESGSITDPPPGILGEVNSEGYFPYSPPGYNLRKGVSYQEDPENWEFWKKNNKVYRKDLSSGNYTKLRPPTKDDLKFLEDFSIWANSKERDSDKVQQRYDKEVRPLLKSLDRPIKPVNNPKDADIEKMVSDGTFCDDCSYRYSAYDMYDFEKMPVPEDYPEDKKSKPGYRYHREWNPFTHQYEAMSPTQHRMLEREALKIQNQGITPTADNMPVIENRELLDAVTRKNVGIRPWSGSIGFGREEEDIINEENKKSSKFQNHQELLNEINKESNKPFGKLKKGGNPKQLRKKFVKEYVKGGIAQNAKASEVARDSAFSLLDFVGRTNKESLLKTKAEKLAESIFPEQSMPAMYRGGIRKAQPGLNVHSDKDANEAAEETYTKAQMEAYVKDQIENSQKAYQEQFQKQFQGYPRGYGYGYGVPGGYGYPYGPGMPSPSSGFHDVGGKGYPLFYNAGPGMGYAGVRYPQLGNLMNMFSKDPDKVTYSSNLSAEELKNVLGDDFQGYDREVLDYDKRFLRKPFEKHVRYTINRGKGKADATKDEKFWEDHYIDPTTGKIISHSSYGNEDATTNNLQDNTQDERSGFISNLFNRDNESSDKKRFNPFNRVDRILRRAERQGNNDPMLNYTSPNKSIKPDLKPNESSSSGSQYDSRQELTPDEGKGTWEGKQQFMEGLIGSQLQLPKTSNNKKESSTDLPEGFPIDTRGPREMAYGGVPKYYPGGPTPLYTSNPLEEENQAILNAGKRNNYGQVEIPDYSKAYTLLTQKDYFSPEKSIDRQAELLPGYGTVKIMSDKGTDKGTDTKNPYIDEKTEEGQSYIDPSAIYNFGVQAFTNMDRYNQKTQNDILSLGQSTNQPIDFTRSQNPYGPTGQLLDNRLIDNQGILAKRGGAMGKYKAGGTYMLEQDVINKIKAAGGIIKFLD